MTRSTMAFAAFLAFLPSAMANMAPRTGVASPAKGVLPTIAKDQSLDLDHSAAPAAESRSDKQNLVLTDDTEVQLDDRVCKFADVPGDASVISLAVAADKKTVLKIRFKSKK